MGAGAPQANPDFAATAGDVPFDVGGSIPAGELVPNGGVSPSEYLNSPTNTPFQSPGFMGRIAGNPADRLNASYRLNSLEGMDALARQQEMQQFTNAEHLKNIPLIAAAAGAAHRGEQAKDREDFTARLSPILQHVAPNLDMGSPMALSPQELAMENARRAMMLMSPQQIESTGLANTMGSIAPMLSPDSPLAADTIASHEAKVKLAAAHNKGAELANKSQEKLMGSRFFGAEHLGEGVTMLADGTLLIAEPAVKTGTYDETGRPIPARPPRVSIGNSLADAAFGGPLGGNWVHNGGTPPPRPAGPMPSPSPGKTDEHAPSSPSRFTVPMRTRSLAEAGLVGKAADYLGSSDNPLIGVPLGIWSNVHAPIGSAVGKTLFGSGFPDLPRADVMSVPSSQGADVPTPSLTPSMMTSPFSRQLMGPVESAEEQELQRRKLQLLNLYPMY